MRHTEIKKGRLNIHWLYPKAKSLLLSSLRRKGNDLLAIRGLEQSCVSYSIKVQSYHVNHWQKINKYKWNYWENIFIGKTDGNIPLLFTERISREKKLKQKKNDYVPFPPTLVFLAPGFFHRGKYKVSSFLYIPISYIFSYVFPCFFFRIRMWAIGGNPLVSWSYCIHMTACMAAWLGELSLWGVVVLCCDHREGLSL